MRIYLQLKGAMDPHGSHVGLSLELVNGSVNSCKLIQIVYPHICFYFILLNDILEDGHLTIQV